MNIEDNKHYGQERDYSLTKSPLVKVYVDTSEMILNHYRWEERIRLERINATRAIEEKIGASWQIEAVREIRAPLQHGINMQLARIERAMVFEDMVLFGFQLEFDGTAIMSHEIMTKLMMDNRLDTSIKSDILEHAVTTFLISGAALADRPPKLDYSFPT